VDAPSLLKGGRHQRTWITGDRLPDRWDRLGQGGGGQGDDLLGVGNLAEDGPLEQEAVADNADEAGRDLVGDGRGDPAGRPLALDQAQQGVADEVGAAPPARLGGPRWPPPGRTTWPP